ncbi:MAG TPA: nucleotidyltransferase family protein [Acidobacteriaceae bacterium]|nr:nucleotidyltransferase family protein [Acidobacteriaceae bacterium]
MHERYADNLELELLFACARWPQRDSDRLLIRELAAHEPDWSRLVQLVTHHRIVPVVSHNLHRALSETTAAGAQQAIAELRRHAAANAMTTLRLLRELKRVLVALDAAGVDARVLKGLPLAQIVFGDISLRAPGDLDVLIDPRQIVTADRVIQGLGYTGLFELGRFSSKQLAYYRAHWKDVTYANRTEGNELDLHWRCFRNPSMPGARLCATGTWETVTFGGLCVKTLPAREGLLYLCVHGTLDGWVYLKPLVDVAAQVRAMTESELDELVDLATRHGILPELSATLLLVRRWLALDHWSRRLLPETDQTVRHILRYVARTLDVHAFRATREEIPISTTLQFEWGLRRGFRYRREVVQRVLYRARMWETIPLPDWLFWAYPLLSPVEWVLFRIRHRRAQAANV